MKEQKLKYLVVSGISLFLSVFSYADTLHCDDLYISDVWVEGVRDDGHALQNMLVVKVNDGNGTFDCGGKTYLHLENTSDAYNSMLSVALSALAANKKVQIAINTNTTTNYSNQLAFIRIKQ